MKIAICDYGIGGLGLYKLIRQNSTADIVYFSDAGFTPYGKVPKAELQKRIAEVIEYLQLLGVDKIAFACNAASTVIPEDDDISGIIEHGINMVLNLKPASIAIVGGHRIVESKLYKSAFEEAGIKTVQKVAQPLSIRIEAGDLNSPALMNDIGQVFGSIKNQPYILLACTHYPVIANEIRSITQNACLLDPVEEMFDWISANWSLSGNSETAWISTGDVAQMRFAARAAFGVQIDIVEKVPLDLLTAARLSSSVF